MPANILRFFSSIKSVQTQEHEVNNDVGHRFKDIISTYHLLLHVVVVVVF